MINRIVWHWSVTGYSVSADTKKHYHFIVDGDGIVHNGLYPVSANFAGTDLSDGYAAHTKNLNSGSIGNAIAAMYGAKESPFTTGPFPMKENQIEALLQLTANQMKQYNVPLTRQNVLSHAEVQPTLGVTQNGKWDYTWIPGLSFPKHPVEVGDILRERLAKIIGNYQPSLDLQVRPTIRLYSRGPDVVDLQKALKITADGIFGKNTDTAVKAFQRSKQLLPDGVVGPMTWAALGI